VKVVSRNFQQGKEKREKKKERKKREREKKELGVHVLLSKP
jgi:hypothetical protein